MLFPDAPETQALNVKWSSSNPFVAAVDLAGRVTGFNPGVAVITAPDATFRNILAVSLTIVGKDLLAKNPNDVMLIGMLRRGNSQKFFEYVDRESDFGERKFMIYFRGEILRGQIDPNGQYELVMYIKDGGELDLDGIINGEVMYSIFIAEVIKSGISSGGSNPNDDEGGGCNSTVGYVFALPVILLFLKKRK